MQDQFHRNIFTILSKQKLDGPSQFISWTVIKENIDKPWNWLSVSRNPNVTWEIIQANPQVPWNSFGVSCNKNITMDIVQEHLRSFKWNPLGLSRNPNLTFEFVKSNIDKLWDWERISCHPNITWDIIHTNPDKPWVSLSVSKNINVTWTIVRDNPEFEWDWKAISGKPSVTWEVVQANPGVPWCWRTLFSVNPSISWDTICENLEKPWGVYFVKNKVTPLEKMLAWDELSRSPKITWDIVKKNPMFSHRFNCIKFCQNPNITWEVLQKNLKDFFWYWTEISRNTVLNLDIVLENPTYKWSWFDLGYNPSIYVPTEKFKKRWKAANVIKKCWFRAVTNPEYEVCRKRLLKEFDECYKNRF